MKVAVAVCMALLAVVLVQAEDEMGPPVVPAGSRVANSTPAAPRQFPYMAYIEAFDDAGSLWSTCGGSLVTRSAVLTSALCVYGGTYCTVRLGSINRTGDDPNAWTVESTWLRIHPKFDYGNRDNNIAIIYLARLAPLNEFIQPVSLPSSPVVSSYVGRQGIVAGWGYTAPNSGMSDVLRWAEVVVVPNLYCKKFTTFWALTDRQMCAGSSTTTAYLGDVGVPLVVNTRGQYILIGIRSKLMTDEFNTSHPVIYTRVTSYIDWIKLYTESD